MTDPEGKASLTWRKPDQLGPRRFTCGFCGCTVAPDKGYFAKVQCTAGTAAYAASVPEYAFVYICSGCGRPTFLFGHEQTPGVRFGEDVDHVPPQIGALYREARDCMRAQCYTGAALCCRKLLMNIAHSKGADAGKSFQDYVDYIVTSNLVPATGKGWVDHIRAKANEATHELPAISRDDARQLISFVQMLLKLTYEFPERVKPKVPWNAAGVGAHSPITSRSPLMTQAPSSLCRRRAVKS